MRRTCCKANPRVWQRKTVGDETDGTTLAAVAGRGAMSALLDPQQVVGLPAVEALLRHAEATRRIIAENYRHITEPRARWMATIEENVLVQLENLRTHPCVAAAMSRGDLRLHGWVYKLESGEVFAYQSSQQQYMPIGEYPVEGRVDGARVRGI